MTAQTEIVAKNHRRAVRYFWCFLPDRRGHGQPHRQHRACGAGVPPTRRHADRCRRCPSDRPPCCRTRHRPRRAGGSFRQDLPLGGHRRCRHRRRRIRRELPGAARPHAGHWVQPCNCMDFPAIIDTAVAVSTLMLVALGDKPARRTRIADGQTPALQRLMRRATQGATAEVTPFASTTGARAMQPERVQTSASLQPHPAHTVGNSAQTDAGQIDADLASELIASRGTTQPVETVIAVLAASRGGASINAAAKASGINYRTAQRIVDAAAEHRQRQFAAVG
jgi:hypothetical protein